MRRLATISIEVVMVVLIMYVSGLRPVELPGLNLPLTLQSMFAILLPLIFTGRNAAGGMLIYLVLAALGVPILAGGVGGWQYFLSDSAGYLIGFYVITVCTSYLKGRLPEPRFLSNFIVFMLMHGVLTVIGLSVIALSGSSEIAWSTHVDPFLPGIIAKSFLGTLIAEAYLRGKNFVTRKLH